MCSNYAGMKLVPRKVCEGNKRKEKKLRPLHNFKTGHFKFLIGKERRPDVRARCAKLRLVSPLNREVCDVLITLVVIVT